MSLTRRSSKALSNSPDTLQRLRRAAIWARPISTTPSLRDPQQENPPEATQVLDPHTVHTHSQERRLWREHGLRPIGSRRKRVAMATNPGVPFEQLPYACFQEARKVLAEHRGELLGQIRGHAEKIDRLKGLAVEGKDAVKNERAIGSLSKLIEKLVLEVDSRDPIVLKSFEDGIGDLDKPIYRHLADQKWREHKRKIVLQRLSQMFVTPDVLPQIDPTASVELRFPSSIKVDPGQFIDSRVSQFAPTVDIKVFDAGKRLVTIVFVDSDVPNLETDDFDHRCHGVFANIEIDHKSGPLQLSASEHADAAVVPWIPPHAQKGAPYHRISAWVLQHAANQPLDSAEVQKLVDGATDGSKRFSMRSFVAKTGLKPVGASMFRTQWDDGMFEIMKRYNIPGADAQLKRRAPEKLPYKKKDPKRYR